MTLALQKTLGSASYAGRKAPAWVSDHFEGPKECELVHWMPDGPITNVQQQVSNEITQFVDSSGRMM